MTRGAFVLLTLLLPSCAVAGEPWTYYIEPCRQPETGCRTGDLQLAQWALESWEKSSNSRLQWIQVKDATKARLRVRWATVREGQYGEMRRIKLNGRTVADLYVLTDVRQLGAEVLELARKDPLYRDSIIYLTTLHEAGHALGLVHTTAYDDVMYTFANGGDIREYFARFRRLLKSRDDIPNQAPLSRQDQNRLLAVLPAE